MKPHVYLLRSHREISPFGPLSEVQIHNLPWSQLQERRLQEAGFSFQRVDDLRQALQSAKKPSVVMRDDVYFTAQALRKFVKKAASVTAESKLSVVRAALTCNRVTETYCSGLQGELLSHRGQDVRAYDVYFVGDVSRVDVDAPLATQAELAPIRASFGKQSAPSHRKFTKEEGRRFISPITLVFMSPLQHWAQVIVCNIMGMPSEMARVATRRWLATLTMPLAAAWRSGSLRPRRLLDHAYYRGSRCRIHPTAIVEGCVIGDRVRIGPHAVLQFCHVGRGAVIGSHANVTGCTIGKRAIISSGTQLRGSTVGEEASLATPLNQMSIFGDRSVMCPNAGIMDYSMRGTVPVKLDGKVVRSGAIILGGAVGHDAFLGPNIEVAGGCEIPNKCILVRDPKDVIRSGVEAELPADIRRLDPGRRRAA